MRLKGIPGTFLDERIKLINFSPFGGFKKDGCFITQYIAKVHDGCLAVLVSRDPLPDGPLWHMSMSHRQEWDQHGTEVFTRFPSWDELKLAKYKFIPADVVMAILFPAKGQVYIDDHMTCLHLWEVPKELAD